MLLEIKDLIGVDISDLLKRTNKSIKKVSFKK